MTVRFTVPRSSSLSGNRQDAIAWARHRQIGGVLARAWGAYELGGEQFAWVIRHGSGCDPRQDVDALADALADGNLAVVVLTPGTDYTSEQVADAIEAELLAEFGHVATVDSVTVDGQTRYRVSIAGALAGIVGSPASTAGPGGTAGIQQARRDGTGIVDGTLWIHTTVEARYRDGTSVAAGTRARITGVAYYGTGGFRGRCAAGLGPAHSLTPASIGPMADAGRQGSGDGSANGYDPIVRPLEVAIPCVIGDDAWIAITDDGTSGDLAYRFHASSGFFGDLDNTENLLLEETRNDPTVALSGTVTPTISANFTVCSLVSLVVEVDDEAENDGTGFAGNGSIYAEWGCQRDAAGETPTTTIPDGGGGGGETAHFRQLTPEASRIAYHGWAQSLAVVDAAEDATIAAYSWVDLDAPPAAAPVLLGDGGGLAGWNTGSTGVYRLATFDPIPIGSDVVSDPYVSIGSGFGVIAGGAAAVCEINFDAVAITFGPDGERVYDQGQSPDLLPSDWVVGGLRDLSEFVSLPTSTMPYDGPAQAWPDPYDLDGVDVRPGNLARGYAVIREQSLTADVVAVETIADTVAIAMGPDLDLEVAAVASALAPVTMGPALELTIAASVDAGAPVTMGPRLDLRLGGAAAALGSSRRRRSRRRRRR